jgi:hypothetical protein
MTHLGVYLLLMVLFFTVLSIGCSSKTAPVTPEQNSCENPATTELGLFRNLWWANPDIPIMDEDTLEKNVDITNVVFDHADPNGYAGQIKKAGIYDDNSYVVAAWQVNKVGENKICFNVLWRDNSGDHFSNPREVFGQDPDPLKYQPFRVNPTVAAHIRDVDGNKLIVVDIIFQERVNEIDNWQLWHVRYNQQEQGNFNDFFCNVGWPYYITNPLTNCIHPDIVFDAAPNHPYDPLSLQRLHLVFEWVKEDGTAIWYTMGEDHFYDPDKHPIVV